METSHNWIGDDFWSQPMAKKTVPLRILSILCVMWGGDFLNWSFLRVCVTPILKKDSWMLRRHGSDAEIPSSRKSAMFVSWILALSLIATCEYVSVTTSYSGSNFTYRSMLFSIGSSAPQNSKSSIWTKCQIFKSQNLCHIKFLVRRFLILVVKGLKT